MNTPHELPPADDCSPSEFRQLADQLAQVEKLLADVGRRVADCLTRSESRAAEADETADESLDRRMAEFCDRIERQIDAGFERLADLIGPKQEPEDEAPAAPRSDAWERALLGPDLAEAPALAFKRRELLDGILAGDAGARALAGQLLVFQSAAAERLPQALKDIGEAYYRWQPKSSPGTNPFEAALIAWLQKTCEAAGIPNTIEPVDPGERFDAARHTAGSRGVEITETFGWIVLRPGGKIYTKAAVNVK